MQKIGFSRAKRNVLKCLEEKNYLHEERGNIQVKNLLAAGEVDDKFVSALIRKSKGIHHESCPHHYSSETEVHIIRYDGWYIKFYFIDVEPNHRTTFISVHQ